MKHEETHAKLKKMLDPRIKVTFSRENSARSSVSNKSRQEFNLSTTQLPKPYKFNLPVIKQIAKRESRIKSIDSSS
jgi:hypothetical protein